MLSSRFRGAICCAVLALAVAAPGASARNAYVANSGSGNVSVLNLSTNAVVATIPVGVKPVDVAIGPDGRFAYVANETDGTISVIDTATNTAVGAPILLAVGSKPDAVAVTPNGEFVYVANSGDDTVSVIDTATNAVIGTAMLPPGSEPDGVAISPDGTRAFVAQRGNDISILDTATNAVIGSVPDALAPSRIAIGPRGGRAFVTNAGSGSVTAFNPANGAVVGTPIPVGSQPAGIAIEPSGSFAYAASPVDGTLTAVDTSLDSPVGTLAGFPGATGVAFTPDGNAGYATDAAGSSVTILNRASGGVAGTIGVGSEPDGIAVVPDQPPRASFLVTPQHRLVKKKLTFHAGASSDPDGRIVNYAWDFGDGKHAQGTTATRPHTYRKPGTYVVTLVVTDDEGCSTEFVFTGQTASCNGSALATATSTVVVADGKGPVLRLAGGLRQRLRGRLPLFAICPREPCAVRARARIVTAFEQHGRVVRGGRRTGLARASLAAGVWGRLALPLPRGARRAAVRALRHGGTAQAKVVAIASDSTGSKTLRKRTVRLILPRRR